MNIKPICELKGFQFKIPRYQRGYRWDSQQLEMLLNDLDTFIKQTHNTQSKIQPFYCLQPMVIVSKGEDNLKRPIYEVVDGQQRLTTLYLLIYYLQNGRKNRNYFDLYFDGREAQQDFIEKSLFADEGDKSFMDNIDNFYLRKAFDSIVKWFKKNYSEPTYGDEEPEIYDSVISDFKNLLCDENAYKNQHKPYAAVIWYKITEEAALTSFSNLNYGKIPLTSTDIIKALLLQKDCYGDDRNKENAARQRAAEWEHLSVVLSNHELKGMIGEESINLIDVIMDLVADDIKNAKKYINLNRKKTNYSEDLFNYLVINRYLNEALDRSEATKEVWDKVRKYANYLTNWFEHRKWYHFIGLYSLVSNKKDQNLIKEVINFQKGRNKKEFVEKLRTEIGKIIKVNFEEIPGKPTGLNHPELRYGNNKAENKMRDILKAFNVYLVEEETDDIQRFPFDKFRKQNPTSLEHIHPKSVDDGNYSDIKAWYQASKIFMTNDEINELKIFLEKESTFKDNIFRVQELVRHIEPRFNEELVSYVKDEKKVIQSNDIHHIKNMALIDKDTNAKLQYNHLDKKRSLLIESQGKGIFVPLGTQLVFSKHFSAGTPDSMKYWLHDDREAYFEKLNLVYNYFTKGI